MVGAGRLGAVYRSPRVRTVAVPAIKRRTDTGQQILCLEGLIGKADPSGAQCPLTNPVVGKCGNNNDGNPVARCSQTALKLKPRHSRQVYVGDQARRLVQTSRLQKLFSGRKCDGAKTEPLQKAPQRLAG